MNPGADTPDSRPAVGSAVGLPRFGAGGSALLSLILASSLFVLFPIGLFVAPFGLVPVLQHVAAGRRGVALWGWVVAALVALAVVGPPSLPGVGWSVLLVGYLLVVVLPSASVEGSVRLGLREGRWISWTTIAATVAGSATVIGLTWPEGPVVSLTRWGRQAMDDAIATYRELGVATGQIELTADSATGLLPWTVVGVAAAYFVFVLFWVRPRLPLLGFTMPVGRFEEYRGDEWLPAWFSAAGGAAVATSGTVRWLAVNLLIAVLLLYFVQGLAMIRAHLARWIGRGWLVRWGVGLVCLYPPVAVLVTVLGIADGFFPLRPRTARDGGEA